MGKTVIHGAFQKMTHSWGDNRFTIAHNLLHTTTLQTKTFEHRGLLRAKVMYHAARIQQAPKQQLLNQGKTQDKCWESLIKSDCKGAKG